MYRKPDKQCIILVHHMNTNVKTYQAALESCQVAGELLLLEELHHLVARFALLLQRA